MKTKLLLLNICALINFNLAIATDYTMSGSGTYTVSCASGNNFYDGGGSNNDYPDNSNVTITFMPSIIGSKICVTFNSFRTQTHYYNQSGGYSDDVLFVYNGNSIAAPQVGALQGQAGYGSITSTAIDGSLTFTFASNDPNSNPAAGTRAGWAATISCNCSQTDITMIASGTFTTCGGNFYDAGGPSGDYMDNQYAISLAGGTVVTLYPATAGAKICVTFNSFRSQTNYYNQQGQYSDDVLYVYNGNSPAAPQVGALQGQAGYGSITSTASDGSLTFKFVTHAPNSTPASGTRSGWAATISCNCTPNDISMIAGGVFTTCGGNFYDAGGPSGDYMDNQYSISPDGGTVLTLYPAIAGAKICVTFSSFRSQTNYYNQQGQYSDDILYVYNGNSTASPQVGALQGQAGYGSITSTANDGSLTFKFVSHAPNSTPASGTRSGWAATISCNCTPNDISMIAGGVFTTCGGNFYDAGGPSGDYMNNQYAISPSGGTVVTLYPATPGAKICVTFSSFRSQTNYYNQQGQYSDDVLYVYNGNSTAAAQVGALQGQAGYGSITSTANDGSLTFKFVSHAPNSTPANGTRSGWSATISCNCAPTDICMIAGGAFTTCGGNFYDAGGPTGDYMSNQYSISPAGGTVVTLYPICQYNKIAVSFSSFATQTNYYNQQGQYSDDVLFVYNGNSDAAPLIATLMGTSVPGTITSSANDGSLTFKFVSHAPNSTPASGTRAGWSATIACVCTPAIGGAANAIPSQVCSGNNSIVSLTGHEGCYIQWQSSSDNISFANINGATNSVYSTPNLFATTYYRASISNGVCTSSNSTVAIVTVNPNPAAPNGGNVFVCANEIPAILTATPPGGCTTEWFATPSGGVSMHSGNTYSVSAAGNYYSESLNSSTGCRSTSRTLITLTINSNPNPPSSLGNVTICQNDTPATVAVTPPVGCSVEWFTVANGGVTLHSGNTMDVMLPGNYYAESINITTGCRSLTRTVVTLVVNQAPSSLPFTANTPLCDGLTMTLNATYVSTANYDWSGPNNFTSTLRGFSILSATLADSGWYVCTIRDTITGCSSMDSLLFVIDTVPHATITQGGVPIFCDGDSVILTATEGSNYLWMPDSSTAQSITVMMAGTYYCSVTNPNGCSGNANTLPINITVNPNPVTPLVTCTDPTIYSSVTATSYTWYRNDTLMPQYNTQNINPTSGENGSWFVVISDSSGCVAISDPCQSTVDANTILDENQFEIYPNPNNGIFTIRMFQKMKTDLSINIFDITGRIVFYQTEFKLVQYSIDFSREAKGIYILQIKSGNQTRTQKLIIQ